MIVVCRTLHLWGSVHRTSGHYHGVIVLSNGSPRTLNITVVYKWLPVIVMTSDQSSFVSSVLCLKVHYVEMLMSREFCHWLILFLSKQTRYQTLFSWLNEPNTDWYCVPLFTCGGPCQLHSFKQCSGTSSSSDSSLFIHFWVCVITSFIL